MKYNKRLILLLAATPLLLVCMIGVGFLMHRDILRTSEILYQHAQSRRFMETTVTELVNAETGQRGYLLTSREEYLEPYHVAMEFMKVYKTQFERQYQNKSISEDALHKLDSLAEIKLYLIASTIALNREGRGAEALEILKTNQGKNVMDTIRGLVADINGTLDKELMAAENELRRKVTYLLLIMALTFVFSALLSILGYRTITSERDKRELMLIEIEEQNAQLIEYTRQSYHQLKTPLRSIGGFLQLLQKKFDQKLDTESLELISFSVQATKDMNTLINNLRDKYLKD